ncbi:MAG: ASKHA domain-containing protein [Armatimonadota bacterium]
MPNVCFMPNDITVEVPEGSLISEAAVLAGLEDLHLPCGGKGTCGKCLVEIVAGEPEVVGHTHLDAALAGRNLVLACQTRVRGEMTVRLTQMREALARVVGDSHLLVSAEYLPQPDEIAPVFRAEKITVPPASIEEHYSDWQRLTQELARQNFEASTRTDVHVLRKLARTLRKKGGKVTVSLQEDFGGLKILDIEPGHVTVQSYGLAIDIGTTTVAVQLVNLVDGRVFVNGTSYNAQIRRGADVISRIDYARTPERQAEMRSLILDTLNSLITGRSADAGIPTSDIRAAFISGNTTMVHLLLGLPPKYIREAPYVPTVNPVPTLSAGDVGLAINPQALVAFSPGVGSYVGGDVTAGLLCTELIENKEEVFLFLDIGTNGEIVLGNADWMVTCACSAGPAFEGSGIKCGMRAAAGAIEYVSIGEGGEDVSYDVIGDTKPSGICGSGLICLLGELFVKGVLDQSGRFNTYLPTDRIVELDNTRGFVLEWGANTENGHDLVITEHDIENIMRTKAAIYAACSLILGNVGLDWSAISKVYIAGGFGRYLEVEDAVLIGLLPDLPYDRFEYIGNSALTGAYIALLSQKSRVKLQEIAQKMTYIDLSSDPSYMDSYLGAMFLPHTDISQFPSVAQRLAQNQKGA